MKKTISTILVCVLLVGSLLTLASCEVFGMLIGTYSDGTKTYEFSGKEVTIVESYGSISVTSHGEYKIGEDEDGNKTIAITIHGDNGKSTTTTYSFNSGKDDGGSYIEIGDGLFGAKEKYYQK